MRLSALLLLGLLSTSFAQTRAVPDSTSSGSVPSSTSEAKLLLHCTIRAYQELISSQDRPSCNFEPSCSHFALDALRRTNAAKGLLLASDRLQRCHPLARRYYGRHANDGRCLDPLASYLPRDPSPGVEQLALNPEGIALIPTAANRRPTRFYQPRALQEFGLFLLRSRDPRRAAGEFERAVWTASTPSDTLLYLAGVSLRACDQPHRASLYLGRALKQYPRSLLRRQTLWQYAYCGLESGTGERGQTQPGAGNLEYLSRSEAREWLLLRSAAEARDTGWQEALRMLRMASDASQPEAQSLRADLEAVYEQAAGGHQRSSLLAGILSTIIPGSGKIYAGRTADGLFSLITIGFSAWHSADGFDERGSSSVKGWSLAGITAWFYAGSIYGSTVAARQYNERSRRTKLDQVTAVLRRHAPEGLGLDAEELPPDR